MNIMVMDVYTMAQNLLDGNRWHAWNQAEYGVLVRLDPWVISLYLRREIDCTKEQIEVRVKKKLTQE